MSGRYEQILNYVISVDFIFFGLTAVGLIVLRARGARAPAGRGMPGHPWTTLVFVAVSWAVVLNTILRYPANTLIGLGILAAGLPVFFLWRRQR
jgi:APA family basic amino acid/polyamine antiporter